MMEKRPSCGLGKSILCCFLASKLSSGKSTVQPPKALRTLLSLEAEDSRNGTGGGST